MSAITGAVQDAMQPYEEAIEAKGARSRPTLDLADKGSVKSWIGSIDFKKSPTAVERVDKKYCDTLEGRTHVVTAIHFSHILNVGQVATIISALREEASLLEQYEVSLLKPGENPPEGSLKTIAKRFEEELTAGSFESIDAKPVEEDEEEFIVVVENGLQFFKEKDFQSGDSDEAKAVHDGSEVVRNFKEGSTQMLFTRRHIDPRG